MNPEGTWEKGTKPKSRAQEVVEKVIRKLEERFAENDLPHPITQLYSYQRKIVEDRSPYKIILSSRQIGKSFTTAFIAVEDCVNQPGSAWWCVSVGERASQEWLLKAKMLARRFSEYMNARAGKKVMTFKATTEKIEFCNGSRISVLPSKTAGIRGFSGNVILDEFALVEDGGKALWGAMVPTTSTKGPDGQPLRIIVCSTINGTNNMFWKLWSGDGMGEEENLAWKRFKVDVHTAVELGCTQLNDVDALRRAVADQEVWDREYLCLETENNTQAFSDELIENCLARSGENFFPDVAMPLAMLDEPGSRWRVGIDLGREKDYSVCWLCKLGTDGKLVTKVVDAFHGRKSEQEERISAILAHDNVELAVIDNTGFGAFFVDDLEQAFPDKVVRFNFTNETKSKLFTEMVIAFQSRSIIIPNDPIVIADIKSMARTTDGRSIRYTARHNKYGHSDRATACALCLHAFQGPKQEGLLAMSGNVRCGFDESDCLEEACVEMGLQRGNFYRRALSA